MEIPREDLHQTEKLMVSIWNPIETGPLAAASSQWGQEDGHQVGLSVATFTCQ